ncbi:YifB family Mg chelatase-like AAA ATPase [Paroceanicella profunda]|uniref:YifB family Mg chelatase-like AAA ATPase n=1 Tax=Paroceanicella profunda TaxID=2579971 RepID=A0A5B8FIN9_9RHOB|nr:YifB family Mg chelatase-like AAA ATPase [Paroceanicella profunda]QDL93447.1 YifB family Mg chelatase-like AAA ATPase [Paroceanicella profunda]
MVSHSYTVSFDGTDAREVDVQCALSGGLPAFHIVGLPDKAVAESRERVRAALSGLGLSLPARRIVINLAPADQPKIGAHFDLPIALSLLAAMEVIPPEECARYVAIGELTLDARLNPVAGALPAAVTAASLEKGLICPAASGPEAALVGEVEILAPPCLLTLLNHFSGKAPLPPPQPAPPGESPAHLGELAFVKGHETAKRAMEVAAAGGHNVLMVGPPGAGKSLLARCLPGLLPPLSAREALEVSMIASVAGELRGGQVSRRRPFRDPMPGVSLAAMIGGGRRALPGEVSRAHNGVLFLDELPSFSARVLESLRQPLETGEVMVARAEAHVTYPARVQLVAAMNPCTCGWLGDANRACGRAPNCARDYQARISGPLLDRIDIRLELPLASIGDQLAAPDGESTAVVARRVARARSRQVARYGAAGPRCNAEAGQAHLQDASTLASAARDLLELAHARLHLTGRGLVRVMRVARTIADLAGEEEIGRGHLAEAIGYRQTVLPR